ncbi:alpha/beta hydrolase family protein [Hymenobacter weizhouensis]|uniref:alpha/beta hydrolase family protein n=1 Tax=Hymenobacter sp. YIM 151500-1 TaxID=2987689 RepID=UPI002227ABCA|nr:alpha/beta hydrolase [Hymenobacter sp. YIM 151500-1]UYZ61868.1 alpha/beta fold hydrolase [Hymenobacter sp. YIM 151500-1]
MTLTSGGYFATLDVPLQKISNMPVQVALRGDTVIFSVDDAASRFTGRLAPDGKGVAGTWHQPGYDVAMQLSYAVPAINTAPKARLTPPYREEEVAFTNIPVNVRFGGMLTVPPGEGPFPAVVLLSDAGSQDRDATLGDYRLLGTLADHLTRRGIAVLRFDDRGVGQSQGEPGPAVIGELMTDAQAALSFLRTRPEIDPLRLGIIGHGQGGNVALLTAAQPLPPAFVVALAAAGMPGQKLLLQQREATLRSLGSSAKEIQAELKREQALQEIIMHTADAAQRQAIVVNMLRQQTPSLDAHTAQASAADLASAYYQQFLSADPTAGLEKVACPVMLLNGTADMEVSIDSNLPVLTSRLKGNTKVVSRKLPGVNHLFQAEPAEWPLVNGRPQPVFSSLALDTIREWIAQQTKLPTKK